VPVSICSSVLSKGCKEDSDYVACTSHMRTASLKMACAVCSIITCLAGIFMHILDFLKTKIVQCIAEQTLNPELRRTVQDQGSKERNVERNMRRSELS
jgi:hypothetical protein